MSISIHSHYFDVMEILRLLSIVQQPLSQRSRSEGGLSAAHFVPPKCPPLPQFTFSTRPSSEACLVGIELSVGEREKNPLNISVVKEETPFLYRNKKPNCSVSPFIQPFHLPSATWYLVHKTARHHLIVWRLAATSASSFSSTFLLPSLPPSLPSTRYIQKRPTNTKEHTW